MDIRSIAVSTAMPQAMHPVMINTEFLDEGKIEDVSSYMVCPTKVVMENRVCGKAVQN